MTALRLTSVCTSAALVATVCLTTGAYADGGETIEDATVIDSLPYTATGSTVGAVDDYDEACPFTGSDAGDLVYAYTPDADVLVSISLCDSGYDTKVFVYENEVTPGAPFACNDDNFDACGPGFRSYLPDVDDPVIELIAGNTYFIVVDGWSGAEGDYVLEILELIPGACCLPDGTCIETLPAACEAEFGIFQGANTTCDEVECDPFTGACCFPDGSCTETIEELCVAEGGTWQGEDTACACIGDINMDGTVDVDDLLALLAAWGDPDPGNADLDGDGDVDVDDLLLLLADWGCQAVVCETCLECDDTENEPICGENYVDETNGGCNSDPAVFQDIVCGQEICGGSGTYLFDGNNYRDTDWFRFVAEEQNIYTWTATANFPLLIFIIQGPCPGSILQSASVDPCTEASISSECLGAGEYYFWVGPSVFSGVSCETAQYVAELNCEPCGLGVGACCLLDGSCVEVDDITCADQGGEYQGPGTTCDEVVCESAVECPAGGIPEDEPVCGPDYVDETNGGCNSDPEVFQSIACGDTICGESGTFLNGGVDNRDTDWFEYDSPEAQTLGWEVVSTFDLLIFIIDGTGGCDNLSIINSATAAPGQTATLNESIGQGIHWVWVGPSVFSGIECGSPWVGTMTCN